MKAVLDTNIYINTSFAPESSSAKIIHQVQEGKLTLVVSQAVLEEYKTELGRSYLQRFRQRNQLTSQESLEQIFEQAEVVSPEQNITLSNDPADNKFLECATAGEVDYLVSSDSDLLDIGKIKAIPIVSPGEFLQNS